jgi:amidase
MSGSEIDAYVTAIDLALAGFDRLESLDEPQVVVKYPRQSGGHRPIGDENPYGAWAWRGSVTGAGTGPLVGKRVAIKDVVAVAGMPLRNGSPVMEGYVPVADATVVTRILDAGGEVIGKATCENLSFSGGSNTSYPEPVRNPRDPRYMAGGSSSGSAALLAYGACDVAIGGDQGGSIRIPSSWCGVVGLKPTFGLVPFTGAASTEPSLDTLGPMGTSVVDVATLLDAIAGPDGLDPRQGWASAVFQSATSSLTADCQGLRIGVLEEGFGWPHSEPDVDETVDAAASVFKTLGADVSHISVPLHRDGCTIFEGVATEGAWTAMIRDGGVGRGWTGYCDTHHLNFFADAWRRRANDLPPSLKVTILLGAYLTKRYRGRYYGRAQNLRRALTQAYDDVFRSVDLLLMPTTPQKAILFDAQRSVTEELLVTANAKQNTCPFNLSGHPAISVPCGPSCGLPIGMMLVGRHFEDAITLRAAHAYEQATLVRTPQR